MILQFLPYKLKLKHPFRLASGSRDYTDSIIIKIKLQGETGYGEASFPPYLRDNLNDSLSFLEKIDPKQLYLNNLYDNILYFNKLDKNNNSIKAALDIALHDLKCKLENNTLDNLYKVPNRDVYSTYTIGISSEEEMKLKLNEAKEFKIIKLKLGSANDKHMVNQLLNNWQKPFCVDVNQGWKDKYQALDMIYWLKEMGAHFIEQPMPTDKQKECSWLTSNSPIPIIADESIQRVSDLDEIGGIFSGINIKLMKCGGIYEANQMILKAKKMGLKTLMGCMAESSCAVSAAAHLAPLCDWADLDGFKLISNDPFFGGINVKDGKVIYPKKNGIGVGLKNLDF